MVVNYNALLACALAMAGWAVAEVPRFPREYSAVIRMQMPYFGLDMPLRVLTSSVAQKVEFYNGLEVDVESAKGTHKFVFNNSERACFFTPSSAGPKLLKEGDISSKTDWSPKPFLPDLSQYTKTMDELVGGTLCHKFVLNVSHGKTHSMDDHMAFYWDPVLEKPVRWRMHSRHVTFGSHTDEYIMDFLTFDAKTPHEADMALPTLCKSPTVSDVTSQIGHFLMGVQVQAVDHSKAGDSAFEVFLARHGKSYQGTERERRRRVFVKNSHLISALNREHAGHTRFVGNQYLDMTAAEVLRFRGGHKRSAVHVAGGQTYDGSYKSEPPASFDWRQINEHAVGPVRDQAMCGSCWAFGLIGSLESIQSIKTKKPRQPLPEQFVVDCTWTNGTDSLNMGCDGGTYDKGAAEIIRKYEGRVPTAAAYGAYISVNGFCKDTRSMETGATITGWVNIQKSTLDVQKSLVSEGPLAVSIMVPDEMLFFDAGVLAVPSCRCDETKIDHSVVLVGYGTDATGADHWAVKNSWSTYWGDQGYIKIVRGELDCCVSAQAAFPTVLIDSDATDLVI